MAAIASITLSLTACLVLYAAVGAQDGDAFFELLALSVALLIANAVVTARVVTSPRTGGSVKTIAATASAAALVVLAATVARL